MEDKIKILFLTANPSDTSRIRLDQEMREIDEMINSSRLRDQFSLILQPAARTKDFQKALLRHKPHIVHFSGHGSESEGLVFEDIQGKRKTVSPKLLAELFAILTDDIRIVVLNACYSDRQANAIREIIDFTVTMKDQIGDQSAILFSSSFYLALAEGRSVDEAFGLGVLAIKMDGYDDDAIPALLVKDTADASQSFLSSPPPEKATASKTEIEMRKALPSVIDNSKKGTAKVYGGTLNAGGNITIAGINTQEPHEQAGSKRRH